jgi:spermidine synthase
MNLKLAVVIALIAGFVSISMEIIWFSIIGQLIKGHAGVFGVVLSLILFGIAFGARIGYRTVKKSNRNVIKMISDILLVAGIINFVGFPLIAWLMTVHVAFGVLILVNIIGISGLLGCIFPLLCHIAVSSNEQKVGSQTSLLYAANIIGATTGPLLTGYFLIDYFRMETIITALCVVLISISLLLRFNNSSFKLNTKYIGLSLFVIGVALFTHGFLYTNFLEHIHFKEDYTVEKKFKHVIQNKSGTISVGEGDVFFGGGAHDGSVNTDPLNYSNGIQRAYMTAALHPSPEKVLMIGLSTGSWANVLADYSGIKELTIIEINSGYVELIKKFPEVSGVLSNGKATIIIDDGRRWLRKNSNRTFDLIVMNTTYHWRENITNLLSTEFLSMCKNSLNDKGVMYWNTTGSPDVIYTAANVFSHVTTYENFVAASDSPFDLSQEEKKANFHEFIRNGDTLFKQTNNLNILKQFLAIQLPDIRDSMLQQNLWQITDNNMATEYKAGVWHKPLFLSNIQSVRAKK